jgi:hypothetical protein
MSEYRRVGGRTYKVRVYDPNDADGIMEDGEMLVCPTYLMDSSQRAVTQHFARDAFVRDQLAAHRACAGHRPGPVIATLCASPTANMTDASNDLLERRGTTVPTTFADRERALDEVERRQQWRTVLDARTRLKIEPEEDNGDDGDEDESNGELAGSAEYGPSGDHEYQPDDDGDADGDEDVFSAPREYKQKGQYGSQEYGHSGGSPDSSGIRAPEDDRERARLERDQRGNNAWRNGPSVSRANANQAQLERWRGE